ncbi:hypothetical protein L596_008180 [Steinernema carpocapsae]|uniref:Transcription elongation factor n=1 Tax=Steinernema carpocapsae TaxID=34508 RepID=A0A4V6A696_STECR|nr:hypothetical protein L596_008180 [Steinernema carpocapsae]
MSVKPSKLENEVLDISKKLQQIMDGKKDNGNVIDMLEALGKLPVTIEILTSTRVGMTINDLRKKTSDDKVSKRAKVLLKEWKGLLNSGNSTSNGKSSKPDKPEKEKEIAKPMNNASSSSAPVPFPSRTSNKDEMRQKWITMIANALRATELPDSTLDPEDLASQLEDALYDIHKGNDKYKAAMRSRVFNLRDKKNPALRENFLTGVVTPERFAKMTSEEMASAEMKEQREKFTKQAISEHQMAVTEGTPSDMFKCGKCGKTNTTYSQMQTRSADEPMTTFVFCRTCGNRWKFC